jgi:hypothetical protein
MDCQRCLFKALVSGSSGRTSVSAATQRFSWWVFVGGDTVRRCFRLGPDSGAAGLSCWARWRARLSSLLKYWPHTPQVKLYLWAASCRFLVSARLNSAAYPTGIGLWRIYMGLLMPGQVSLLCKFYAAFLTGEHRHGLKKTRIPMTILSLYCSNADVIEVTLFWLIAGHWILPSHWLKIQWCDWLVI